MIVLPAFGGDMINPLWPLPIGEAISIRRAEISSELPLPCSNRSLLFACKGVKFSKRILFLVLADVSELIVSIFK